MMNDYFDFRKKSTFFPTIFDFNGCTVPLGQQVVTGYPCYRMLLRMSPSLPQFFDQDKDGSVSMSDISQVLPVTKLPQVHTPKMLRRRKGRGTSVEANPPQIRGVLSEQEEKEEEAGGESMDFGES